MFRSFKKTIVIGGLVIMAFSFFACGKKIIIPYHAVVVESGLSFQPDFLKNNMTYGAYYYDDNGELVSDRTSPGTRTYIITNQDEFDEVFISFPQIDFDKEMILLYCYTTENTNQRHIKSVELDGGILKIGFSPDRDTTGIPPFFQRRILVVKIDEIEIETVEFTEI